MARMPLLHTNKTLKNKLNTNIDKVIKIMEECLETNANEINPKDRFNMASQYLSLYLRLGNEIMKEEVHREDMKQRRTNGLIKEHQLAIIEDEANQSGQPDNDNNPNFTTQYVS